MLAATACIPGDDSGKGLTLFAAASLRAVSDELESAWLEEHPDLPLTIATEASNVLAAQIEEGAQADVFISADERHPAHLAAAGHTAAIPVPFARNEVALVARTDGPITQAADLAEPGVRIVVAGPSTPIGRYTAAALDALAQTAVDPVTFSEVVEANIASREDNVRAALAKVELGEGDAAFVYRTDALESEDTIEVWLPASARVGAVYSAVRLSEDEAAATFIEWLSGSAATAILIDAGFEPAA